jgi:hypothetical protein
MSKKPSEQTIIVTGDIAMDWNLARTRRSRNDASFWSADDITNTTWQRGGAALLADLVQAIARICKKQERPDSRSARQGRRANPARCRRMMAGITTPMPCGQPLNIGLKPRAGQRKRKPGGWRNSWGLNKARGQIHSGMAEGG